MALPLSGLSASSYTYDAKAKQLNAWRDLSPSTRKGTGIELETQFFAAHGYTVIPWNPPDRKTALVAIRGSALNATTVEQREHDFWIN